VKEATRLDDEAALARRALHLHVSFEGGEIFLFGQRVTDAIRSEECGIGASRVAALPAVRAALLERQRAFRTPPAWLPKAATWARWCSRTPSSRCF